MAPLRPPTATGRLFALVFVAILAAVAFPPRPSAASVAMAMSLADLVDTAAQVVVVDCMQETAVFDDRGRIVTDVEVRVVDAAKGTAHPGETLVVRTLGGVVGDLGMRVPGAARIPMGSRRVLFLTPSPARTAMRVVGMSQGAFPVRRASAAGGADVVLPAAAGLSLVRPDGRGGLLPAPSALSGPTALPTMLDAIRELATGGAR